MKSEHLKLFIKEHLWIGIIFLLSAVIFGGLFLGKQGAGWGDILYYALLPLLILFFALGYRLYATWNYYELMIKQGQTIDEYILTEVRSSQELNLQKMLKNVRSIYNTQQILNQEERKTHKILIYQWVHQLKTRLSVIDLIAQNHSGEEDYKKVSGAVKEMKYDLDQLLAMYRLDKLESDFVSEKVNLYQLVKDSVNTLKDSFIEHEVYPRLDIDREINVYTDKKWMGFVLYQLLSNAVKYSEKTGSICVFGGKQGERTRLSIADNGCGIAPEDLKRIFELFYTGQNGRRFGESSGMGLYMVKRVLTFLGHTIEVKSEIKKGSEFIIVI